MNGKIRSSIFWQNDKKEGEETYWYDNGELKSKRFYQNYEQHGPYTEWKSDGSIHFQSIYEAGREVSYCLF